MRISDWSSDVCSSVLKAWPSAEARCPCPNQAAIGSAWMASVRQASAARKVSSRMCHVCMRSSARRDPAPHTSAMRDSPRLVASAIRVARKRSEEHTSELQSLMRISYAVFCLKKKKKKQQYKVYI